MSTVPGVSQKQHTFSLRWLTHIHNLCIILIYVILLLCIFMNIYVMLSREHTIFYLRVYHSIVGLMMLCCAIIEVEFLYRTRNLPKLDEPHEIPTPALIGAVALTIGIAVGYLYFIIFNYAYKDCDKLVDAIYPSELWLDALYNLLMSGFSVISLIYIMQRRYYGAIDTNLDKVGRLFINVTFVVVWIKVVIYKAYLSHQELCQRKELEGYWCPVMKRHYECSPTDDLHGMQKLWYYLNKGILSTAIISCASEFYPVLIVSHWLSCGGAEEKAEDILRRRQAKLGVRGLLKNFFSDISRVYGESSVHTQPLTVSNLLVCSFWIVVPLAMAASVSKWMTFFYYTIGFDHLVHENWLTSDYVGLSANVIMTIFFGMLYLWSRSVNNDRLDAHHKATARGDITLLFGCSIILFIKLILQSIEQEYQHEDGFIKQSDAIMSILSYVFSHICLWLQYFALRRILSLSDRDIKSTKKFLPLAGVGGLLIAWVQFGYTFFDTALIKYQLTDETFKFSATTLICMIFTQTIFPADYLFHFTASGCYLELLQRYLEAGFFQIGSPRLSVSHHEGHGGHGHSGEHALTNGDGHNSSDKTMRNTSKPPNTSHMGSQMASMFRAAAIMDKKRREREEEGVESSENEELEKKDTVRRRATSATTTESSTHGSSTHGEYQIGNYY